MRETIDIIGQVSMKYCIPFDFLSPFLQYYSGFCEKQDNRHFKKNGSSEELSFVIERMKIIINKN